MSLLGAQYEKNSHVSTSLSLLPVLLGSWFSAALLGAQNERNYILFFFCKFGINT